MLPILILFTLLFDIIPTYSHTQVPLLRASDVPESLTFRLRQLHATSDTSHVLFADVPHELPSAQSLRMFKEDENYHLRPYTVDTTRLTTHRLPSFDTFNEARFTSNSVSWEEEEIIGPDTTSRETLLQLAMMTNNAYEMPQTNTWYELGPDWNATHPVGWNPDDDGFRGYIFVSNDNSTVIISIKGTSTAVLGGGGPTASKDKLNDNLLFSCCCAKVGITWTPVCDCFKGGWKCDTNCLEKSLVEESLFYPIGTNLYNNVSYMYPNANIWLVGHSLGGALASLLGATFGAPVVAFEAPGERMAARRLHLPSPPSTQHIIHVYNTADPIPMGVCNGIFSSCALVGYALESRCHLGKSIVYDTVSKLNWSVGITCHKIVTVIEQILNVTDWEVPVAKAEDDCIECYEWEYGDFANLQSVPPCS